MSDRTTGAFNRSGAPRAIAIDTSKAFNMLVIFTNLSLMEFLVMHLALFRLFLVKDGFEWFWMDSLSKNILLMLVFPKGPFLVLHFFYYTSVTFLTMLSVILLYVAIYSLL